MKVDTPATERPLSLANIGPMLFRVALAMPALMVPMTPKGDMAYRARNFIGWGELGLGAPARVSSMGTRAME